MSAGYQKVEEDVIVCDFDVSLNELGYRLPSHIRLCNTGKTGLNMGLYASGVIINLGETETAMGSECTGVAINFGKSGWEMGDDASGIILNFGESNTKGRPQFDNPNNPALREYCEELRQKFEALKDERTPEVVLSIPKTETLKQDLKRLIGEQ